MADFTNARCDVDDSPLSSPDSLDVPLYSPRKLKITVVQDPSCCWCFIGRHEMERAAEMLKERDDTQDVQVTWEFKPWVVDPSIPADAPIDRVAYCAQKHGAKAEAMHKLLCNRANNIGIDFKIGPLRSPALSNRLIMRAYQVGGGEAQRALIDEIGKRVFERGEDVGCLSVLSDCAASTGLMCREQAIAFLTSTRLEEEVSREMLRSRKCGVIGVPFTVLNDKWAVCGGQPAETYLKAFTQVLRGDAP